MIKLEFKNADETKVLIGKKGKSLRSFSRQIGVSQPYLSQVLNLKNNPSATVAKKIAEGLDLEIEDIFFIKIDNKSYQKGVAAK
ncbi:helix-turn-helix domain-containing protein [Planococcus beigongshangi]|uniref:helix-turn-helix domain-containing protein n=1 Tax=Planococcus beigongshangi TaxID=2782536 RepID=UPI00193BD9D3|nr:helix-turn-helix transcriptional regulator [Planococcus beigongshangi]